jgi:hypothetical protein
MQESSYRWNRKPNHAGAAWLRQFTRARAKIETLQVDDQQDDRMDIQRSTQAAINYLQKIYNILAQNSHFHKLVAQFGFSDQQQELLLSFMTINGFNSWEGHMERALRTMVESQRANQRVVHRKAQHGHLWVILYLTNEYPKSWDVYQTNELFGREISPKYYIESPEYVYLIFPYYQIDQGG